LEAVSFASCADQRRPQPLWNQILLKSPGLHLALGDNVYPGGSDSESLSKAYQQLLRVSDFMNFRSLVPIYPPGMTMITGKMMGERIIHRNGRHEKPFWLSGSKFHRR
ncbi:MAG: hypothetical protein WCH11_06005, partial [Bdellovibrio sp.]